MSDESNEVLYMPIRCILTEEMLKKRYKSTSTLFSWCFTSFQQIFIIFQPFLMKFFSELYNRPQGIRKTSFRQHLVEPTIWNMQILTRIHNVLITKPRRMESNENFDSKHWNSDSSRRKTVVCQFLWNLHIPITNKCLYKIWQNSNKIRLFF